MNKDANLHAEDWKSGTEALALCMICGGEYPPHAQECPDCHVSLSVVRRCPACQKIVSAQHTKCVYCRTPFIQELPKRSLADEFPVTQDGGVSPAVRRFRAAVVSISTFLIVFFLGMFFLRMINKPVITIQVIAKAHMVHATAARRSPSSNASNLGKLISGTPVNVTGYQESDEGRWMSLDWNDTVAYVPAADVSAPVAINTQGADALKFYIGGIENVEPAREAKGAVDQYAKAFPGDAHIDELRFVLAERLRAISSHAGPQAAELRNQSTQLFEQLAAGNGSFAEKARAALTVPSTAHPPRSRVATPKKEALQIIGGSGTRTSVTSSGPRQVQIH